MHPAAASLLDRLSLTPRPGRGGARVGFGAAGPDARLGGGLMPGALHEIRAAQARDIGAAAGALLGLIARLPRRGGRRRILWVTDPAAAADAGLLCPDGVAQYGLDPAAITLVTPVDLKTALWAAEEGAKCPDLAAVVLHVRGNPRRLDRTATRRLALRAETSGVFVCLLRQSGEAEAGAARTRWRAEPRPARPDPAFAPGIGPPRLELALERSRSGRTGRWALAWNPERKAFEDAPDSVLDPDALPAPVPGKTPALPVARLPASAHRPDRPGALGQVVDLRRPPP